MNKRLFFVTLLLMFLTACARSAPPPPAAPPVNTQATVNAAVAATANAQTAVQATIDAAVNTTATAIALANPTATATPVVVTATASPAPAVTPAEDTVATMTEDELAALIDEAVAEAYASSATYSDAATEATADNTVTQEEIQMADAYYADTEAAIAYAEELMQLYDDMYGELTYEAIDELNQMESDMEALTESVLMLNDTMTEIADLMAQGLAMTEDVLTQLDSATQLISENVATAQTASEAWHTAYQSAQTARIESVNAIQPTNITADPAAALQSVASFAQLGQAAMADYKITPEELTTLAQQGANAAASLNATGNPKLQDLSGMINGVTGMFAAGNIPAAQTNLSQLSMSMDALKGLPEMGQVEMPSVPNASRPSAPSMPSKPARRK